MEKAFCINQYLLKVSKLINKDLAQSKVYNYFNIGDAKTGKIEEKVEHTLFYKYKGLDFGIKFKNKLRTKPGLLSDRIYKNKVFRLAILNIKTKHQNRA